MSKAKRSAKPNRQPARNAKPKRQSEFTVENVEEFVAFLENCGGFEIW